MSPRRRWASSSTALQAASSQPESRGWDRPASEPRPQTKSRNETMRHRRPILVMARPLAPLAVVKWRVAPAASASHGQGSRRALHMLYTPQPWAPDSRTCIPQRLEHLAGARSHPLSSFQNFQIIKINPGSWGPCALHGPLAQRDWHIPRSRACRQELLCTRHCHSQCCMLCNAYVKWACVSSRRFLSGFSLLDFRVLPFCIQVGEDSLAGAMESHEVDTDAFNPLLVSLFAQAKLGLIKDMTQSRCYIGDLEVPMARCVHTGLLLLCLSQFTRRSKLPRVVENLRVPSPGTRVAMMLAPSHWHINGYTWDPNGPIAAQDHVWPDLMIVTAGVKHCFPAGDHRGVGNPDAWRIYLPKAIADRKIILIFGWLRTWKFKDCWGAHVVPENLATVKHIEKNLRMNHRYHQASQANKRLENHMLSAFPVYLSEGPPLSQK